jgi:anti-anti-sigma regulatory factor
MSIKLPIVKIAKLIGTLVKSAKGGIDDAEAQELLEQLSDLIVIIVTQIAKTKE